VLGGIGGKGEGREKRKEGDSTRGGGRTRGYAVGGSCLLTGPGTRKVLREIVRRQPSHPEGGKSRGEGKGWWSKGSGRCKRVSGEKRVGERMGKGGGSGEEKERRALGEVGEKREGEVESKG